MPVLCEQCVTPTCVNVCPNGALEIDGIGIVSWHEDLCTYCGVCQNSCPYNAIRFVSGDGKEVLIKCNLCQGDPMCAKYCAPGALEWHEWTREMETIKKMKTKSRMKILKEMA